MLKKCLSYLSFTAVSGTLLCCVLPALIASLAGGATLAAILSNVPWIITLSKYKLLIFILAALLLGINALILYRKKPNIDCDIAGGKGCDLSDVFSKRLFYISCILYVVALFFSYALVPLMQLLRLL